MTARDKTARPPADPTERSGLAPRTLALVSMMVAVAALAVFLFFTNRDDSVRNDALLYLDRYDELDVDDPVDDRRERVDRLDQLPLGSPEVDGARDLCVVAHRTLIRAEDASALARATFERATAGGVPESDIPTETRATIESSLAESSDALELTREQMPRCDDAARQLRIRFARH